MPPSGKWELQVEDTTCVLSRRYGAGASTVTLVMRKRPLSPEYDLALLAPVAGSGGAASASGKSGVAILIRPSSRTVRADVTSMTTGRLRVAKMPISAADFADIMAGTEIAVTIDRNPPVTMAIRGGVKAAAALKTCADDLLREWKIDPAENDRVATSPSAKPATWFSDDDYPAAAKGAQGRVLVVFRIGTDGKISDCRTVASSGSPVLDETTCRLITARLQFKPALDKDGKSVVAYKSIGYDWRRR